MASNKGDRSQALSGPISDRIRSGEIAAGKVERAAETPSADAVRNGEGHSMGSGATDRGGRQGAE